MALSLPKLTLKLKSLIHYPFSPSTFLLRFFSSSSTLSQNDQSTPKTDPSTQPQNNPSSSSSPFAAYISDIKSKLKQQQQQQQQQTQPGFGPTTTSIPSKDISFEDVRKNLSEFRRRSNVPDRSYPSPPHVSFEELYKKNVLENRPGTTQSPPTTTSSSSPSASYYPNSVSFNRPPDSTGKFSFEAIRDSLKQMRNKIPPPPSGVERKDSLRVDPVLRGGTQEGILLGPVLQEVSGEKDGEDKGRMDTEFVKAYTVDELGKKLRELRPEDAGKKEGWFSLEELNDRLRKLRELEEKEAATIVRSSFSDLRDGLVKLWKAEDDKTRKTPFQRVNILNHLGVAPNYMMQPPKEELVEKYFHPDNMSASEKLKIELTKVRDEFKMSESDCGSARVQVAQLTTKIKYLSSVLHKKDKHSLKGLQAMVQQRKKLLKYLRRTDWDSYCLVLDKLGLRDNPDFKIRSQ